MTMKEKKWYLPSEVVVHNKYDDIWVVVNYRILNITALVRKYVVRHCPCDPCASDTSYTLGTEVKYLVAMAGKDISHMFDENGEVITCVHPMTGARVPYLPHGAFPGIAIDLATPIWRPAKPDGRWWRDDRYLVGYLTHNARPLTVTNTLTSKSVTIMVCEEETIWEIMKYRYRPHNPHYASYNWRYLGHELCGNKTLTQNGVADDRRRFLEVNLPEDFFTPTVLLFYNDDITIDPPKNVEAPLFSQKRKSLNIPKVFNFSMSLSVDQSSETSGQRSREMSIVSKKHSERKRTIPIVQTQQPYEDLPHVSSVPLDPPQAMAKTFSQMTYEEIDINPVNDYGYQEELPDDTDQIPNGVD